MMKKVYCKSQITLFILISTIFVFLNGCNGSSSSEIQTADREFVFKEKDQSDEIAVSPPPFSDEYIFPCSECHDYEETNPNRRVLVDMHDEITASFSHDNENRWCLDCHDANNRDSLRLASGKLLKFEDSYKLCGQCHGNKLRDWKVGVHGKRTGEWDGQKEYLLCVHCHNPHAPKFEKLRPEPPPIKQEDLINQGRLIE
jgi:hypothetical protein